MKKLIPLLALLTIISCANQKAIEAKAAAKAKHQAETGSRLNESQKNTSGLFDEMQ